jgi:hypothetical protein
VKEYLLVVDPTLLEEYRFLQFLFVKLLVLTVTAVIWNMGLKFQQTLPLVFSNSVCIILSSAFSVQLEPVRITTEVAVHCFVSAHIQIMYYVCCSPSLYCLEFPINRDYPLKSTGYVRVSTITFFKNNLFLRDFCKCNWNGTLFALGSVVVFCRHIFNQLITHIFTMSVEMCFIHSYGGFVGRKKKIWLQGSVISIISILGILYLAYVYVYVCIYNIYV